MLQMVLLLQNNMSYISDTRGIITASKLKDFILCEKLYKVKRLNEVCISEEIPDRATLWEAFHYLVEVWFDKRSERYQITEKFLKADLIELIASREISEESKQAKIKELWKLLLPQLREEYYWKDKREEMQGKIELTPAESNMMIGMYESIYKQHLRDMQGIYTKERRFEAHYWWLKIGFKPDRICFYIKWEQCTVENIDDIKKWMSEEDRIWFVKDMQVTCLIRDYKTVWQLDKMLNELRYDNETSNWYVMSMSFYYACIYALYKVESDVYIDAVEKSEPYKTSVISIPKSRMKEKLVGIIKPWLDRLIKCTKEDKREEPSRDELLSNKKLSWFYKYFDNCIQEKPTIIDLAL